MFGRYQFICVFFMMVVTTVPSAQLRAQDETIRWISLINLIANPNAYDGKVVGTEGFLCLREEQNILYLHDEDYRHLLLKNGLTLRAEPEQIRAMEDKNYHYVRIVGTFDAHGPGSHATSGVLRNIKRVETKAIIQEIPQNR
jgi:hypothetical protein